MNPEIKLSKIKQIDYESIINTANGYKKRSKESAEKMKNILKKSKDSKCNTKSIEHKKIWNLESIRLNNNKRKIQRDIEALNNMKGSSLNSDTSLTVNFSQLSDQIRDEHMQFKKDVIDQVWTLCEDLKEWKLKKSRGYKVPEREPILSVINLTKSKLNQVSNELKVEEEKLTNSLELEMAQYYSPCQYENIHLKVGTGIPIDAWDIDCYDKDVLTDLLSQFILIDSYFQSKLDAILEECEFVDKRSAPDDWPDYLVELFEHLHDVYFSHVTVNRNELWQNIIRIVFPNSCSKILAEVEQFVHHKRLFREKSQALIADWKHDRTQLFNKIKSSIIEYNDEILITQIEADQVRIQKEICRQLNEKVNKWREQKEQLHTLEEVLAAEKEERSRIELEEQSEKELMMRNKTKQKIFQYKVKKNYEAELQFEEKQRRVDELRAYLDKQALVDNERVEYREQLRLQRVNEDYEKKQIAIEKQKLSELKLNQLIEQVRPHVDSDPDRLFQPTTAWLHHTDDDGDQSVLGESVQAGSRVANRYALPLHTYNAKDVMSDPRCRVENALREAGLMNSEYARNVMKTIPTNHIPRKDCNLSGLNFLKHD